MAITAGSDALASDFVSTSAGAGDSGKAPKVNSLGRLDSSFFGLSLTAGQAFTAGQAAYMDTDSNCVSLNGTTQYLSSTGSNLGITGNLTLEMWVNFPSLPGSGSSWNLISRRDATAAGWRWMFENSAGTYRFKFEDAAGTNAIVSWTPSTSTWYHVAVVYTAAAGSAAFYVNGAQQGTTQTGLVTTLSLSTHALTIGCDLGAGGSTPSAFLTGKVDAPRVWNTARTGGAIAADYNKLLAGTEANLIGYWALNGDLTDRTSNAYTLTNNGSATFSTSAARLAGQYVRVASAALADTANTFVGFALTAISALAMGAFAISGSSAVFSGLTPGSQYYLSNTPGAVATTAGTVTRKVGIAVDATQLVITNVW